MRKIVLIMLFIVGFCTISVFSKDIRLSNNMRLVFQKIYLSKENPLVITWLAVLYKNKNYLVEKLFKKKYKADRKLYENNIFTGGPYVRNKYKMYSHKTGRYEKEKEEAIRFKVPLSKKSKEYLKKYIKKYGLYIHKMIVIGKDIFLVHQTTKKVGTYIH